MFSGLNIYHVLILAISLTAGILLYRVGFFEYMKSIMSGNSNASSKRFLAIIGMALVSYAVVRFTNHENFEFVVGQLLVFILGIFGAAVYQDVTKHKRNMENKKETENETED